MKKIGKSTSSLMSKMAVRTVLKSWPQYLAIIFITAIAMTLYVGLTSNAQSIKNRVDTLYEGGNIADIWTSTTSYDENDRVEINKLIGDGGETEMRYSSSAQLNTREATSLLSDELPTINKPYETDNTKTEDFFIIDEVFIETQKNGATNLKWINDDGTYAIVPVDFSFSGVREYLKDTQIQSAYFTHTAMDIFTTCTKSGSSNIFDDSYLSFDFQISGSMMFPENVQSSNMNNSNFLLDRDYFLNKLDDAVDENFALPEQPASPLDPDYAWIYALRANDGELFHKTVNAIKDSFRDNQYVSTIGSSARVSDVKNAIDSYFDNKDESNLLMCLSVDSLPSNVTIQSDITQARQLAYIFPMIFFLVAILVVLTTLSQTILKDRTQIGTMKALGISRKRIIVHYLLLSLIVVAIGIALGIIIGPFILPFIMNQKYAILYTLPNMTYTLAVIEALIASVSCLALSTVVTFIIARKEVRLKPAESMRPASPKAMKKVSRNSGKVKSTHWISSKMAFRNIRVNLPKAIMVAVGVAGCTALLVCGFGIDDTLNHGVDHDITNFYSADITASYSTTVSLKDEIMAIDGVDYAEEYTSLPATISATNVYQSYVFAIPDDSQFFKCDDGYQIKGDVAMSSKIADAIGAKVGDPISFSVLGVNYSGTVGFIMDVFYYHGIYVNSSYSNYGGIYETKTSAWVNIKEGANADDIGAKIGDIGGIASYRSKEKNIETINSYMSSISLMTLAVKVFAILLAVVVLYNLALLNYRERIRDIATLKVLGFNRFEIAESLIIEIMMSTLVGIVVGLFLGKPMEILVLMVNRTPLVDFLYTVYPTTYLVAFLITFGTALLVNLWLGNMTHKVKMVESLKSIE